MVDDETIDPEGPRGPGDRSEILGVVEALEHGDASSASDEFLDGGMRATFGAGDHTAVQVEADRSCDHLAFGDVDGDAPSLEYCSIGSEPFDPRRCQQYRPNRVTRLDEAIDGDVPLRDEGSVALVPAAERLIVELAIVVEQRIGRLGDRRRGQRAKT